MKTQPLKKWKLELDGVVRAFNVILPADVEEHNVLDHMVMTRKNSNNWPDSDDVKIKLTFEYVKAIYVSDSKLNKVSKTSEVKEFSKPAYTYEVVKVFK